MQKISAHIILDKYDEISIDSPNEENRVWVNIGPEHLSFTLERLKELQNKISNVLKGE